MPFYAYYCDSCEESFDRKLPISRYDEPQTCETCHAVARKMVVPVGVIFKGDDWATKNGRVQGQMRDKANRLAKGQTERKRDGPGVKLVPNVAGERVDTWTEAQKLATSKGKDASTFTPFVAAEKATKNA